MLDSIGKEDYGDIEVNQEVKVFWHEHVLIERNSKDLSWDCKGKEYYD